MWRLLDEVAFAGAEHLDEAYVEGYDRKARVDPTDDLADLSELGLDGASTLVDLGAGTGTFALAAARICRRVIAVDVSPAMVEAMRRRTSERRVDNVECIQAGFLSYEHTGPLADFVYTRNALHHLPDFWKAIALRRIAAILRPGGVLRLRDLVFAFDLEDVESSLTRWLKTGAAHTEDGWTREELETHLRTEFSTFTWLLEPTIERAGFRIERAEYGDAKVYADYTCTRRNEPASASST